MSAIWENDDEIKEKLLLLSPVLQETFLRAVDTLYHRESSCMLAFIQESRDELLGTHKEIQREQEVLRDTSDLLASKRIYGDPNDWKDTSHETNAIDAYLRKKHDADVGDLGILSFENEYKPRKKNKKKDKDRDKSSSARAHSEIYDDGDASEYGKKHKKEKHKHKDSKKDKVDKDRNKEREKEKEMYVDTDRESEKEKTRDKDKEKEKEKDKDKEKDKEKEKEKKHKHKKEKERSSSRHTDREKSVILTRENTDIEAIRQETNELMQEYINRESSTLQDERAQQEQAMMRKLAKKKNPLVAQADELFEQQRAAESARDREKKAYEAKMMEKLRMRREQSALSREVTALDEPGEVIKEPKHKKEKKKKKRKDNDDEYSSDKEKHKKHKSKDKNIEDEEVKKEKKKHKKKDKVHDLEIEDL